MYQNLSRTDDSNHRHGKNLMTYNKVGERVQSCNKYHSSMKVFFKKYSKNNLKLAYIHPIKHHVDIGLLELFLLTYAHYDYHCIHITSNELTKETVTILKNLVNCFNKIYGEKRLFLANQDTPSFWKLGKYKYRNVSQEKCR